MKLKETQSQAFLPQAGGAQGLEGALRGMPLVSVPAIVEPTC